jgi:hypothetical protein
VLKKPVLLKGTASAVPQANGRRGIWIFELLKILSWFAREFVVV